MACACLKTKRNPAGSSGTVRTGEWVIAMGSPLQLKNTITVGVVSTVHRASQDIGLNKNIDYIQV